MKPKITDLIEEMVTPILEEAGLELVEIEYKKEGANWVLRVFMDRPDAGVDLEDCARVSERLSALLDERDPIPTAYLLEVSSAGAERPLRRPRDFERSVGKRVHLSFYQPVQGHKTVEGTLLSVDEVGLRVELDADVLSVEHDKVAAARLALIW